MGFTTRLIINDDNLKRHNSTYKEKMKN